MVKDISVCVALFLLQNTELKNCERVGINNTYKGRVPWNEVKRIWAHDIDTFITMLPHNPRSLRQGGITTFFQVSHALSIPFGIEEPGIKMAQTKSICLLKLGWNDITLSKYLSHPNCNSLQLTPIFLYHYPVTAVVPLLWVTSSSLTDSFTSFFPVAHTHASTHTQKSTIIS